MLQEATSKGHLDQYEKNQHIKQFDFTFTNFEIKDMKTNQAFITIETVLLPTGRIYNDQIGKFPLTSINRNKYIFILFVYNSNAILVQPLPSRDVHNIIQAYQTAIKT